MAIFIMSLHSTGTSVPVPDWAMMLELGSTQTLTERDFLYKYLSVVFSKMWRMPFPPEQMKPLENVTIASTLSPGSCSRPDDRDVILKMQI